MKWGIIGALDTEVLTIQEAMTEKQEVESSFIRFTCGKLGDQEVVVCCCGIGTVNAAANAQMMIDRFGVDCIINTGIAGAADKRLKVMDLVISTEVIYHDRAEDPYIKYSPYKICFPAEEKLIARAEQAAKELSDITFYKGRIATGDVFVTNSQLRDSIIEKCRPLCIEMEGAAIGQVACMNEIPFLVLRTMSDNADDDGDETYNNFFETAAHRSASILLKIIALGALI